MKKLLWLHKVKKIIFAHKLASVALGSAVLVVMIAGTGWAYYSYTVDHNHKASDEAAQGPEKTQPTTSSEASGVNPVKTDAAEQPSGQAPTTPNATSSTSSSKPNTQKPLQSSPLPPAPSVEYGQVTPNPYCPAPNFSLSAVAGSNAIYLDAIPEPGDPSSKPECGGGINFNTPIIGHPSSDYFCDTLLIPYPTGHTWGFSCTQHGGVSYGVYTFTFTVTGTNGYGKSTTRSTTYTFNYQQQ